MRHVYIRCQKYIRSAGSVIARTAMRPYRSFNLYALSCNLHGSSTSAIMKPLPNFIAFVRGVFYCHVALKGQSANVATLRSK